MTNMLFPKLENLMVLQKSKPNNEREHLKIENFLSIIQLISKHNRLEANLSNPNN